MKKAMLWLIFLTLAKASLAGEESCTLPDGSAISYLIELPASGKTAPLAIVIGGGTGGMRQAQNAMNKLGKPLVKRGWVAVSPISPDESSFFAEPGLQQLQDLIKHLLTKAEVVNGKILIGGLSNGGISALSIAQRHPENFRGVMMTPGLIYHLPKETDLKKLPVYLRIGAKDNLGWGDLYDKAVTDLTRANAKLNAKLLKDAGHGFQLSWEEIDEWLKGQNAPACPPSLL